MTSAPFSGRVRPSPADPQLRCRDEKIESLKAVAGKLAHDFNNFLVPQFGYLTLMKEELPEGSTALQYAVTMEGTARRTESYIESILLGMRPHRQFTPSEFSFSGLVESQLQVWESEITPGTEITIERRIEPFQCWGDERHWRSAVNHLLANARFALATGGGLTVELVPVTLDEREIERLGVETDRFYRLVVRDNGFGMAPEVLMRAFEPFFTTRGQVKAAGLGLTIVHSVAQFHGGQVELQSGEEQGTTVTLWIPADGARNREKLPSVGSRGKEESSPKKKVLLIGDDPLVIEILRDWLARMGLEVHVAADGVAAAKALERKRQEWSLVVIEADLRESRGDAIYSQLHRSAPSLPWIFLAGRRRPEFSAEILEGASAPLVVQKPVTLRSLREVVQQVTR